MPVVSYGAPKGVQPTTVIVHCPDPRFEFAFTEFPMKELGLRPGEFVRCPRKGGPVSLAHPEKLRQEHNALMAEILFFLNHFPTIGRLVNIGHQDCGFYRGIPDHPDTEDKEKKDLPRAKRNLLKIFPTRVQIAGYYAQFTDNTQTQISFEAV
jgi:carbonic anhydrase